MARSLATICVRKASHSASSSNPARHTFTASAWRLAALSAAACAAYAIPRRASSLTAVLASARASSILPAREVGGASFAKQRGVCAIESYGHRVRCDGGREILRGEQLVRAISRFPGDDFVHGFGRGDGATQLRFRRDALAFNSRGKCVDVRLNLGDDFRLFAQSTTRGIVCGERVQDSLWRV